MAFFPVNYGDSKMHYTSHKSKGEINQPPIEDDDSLTWHDAFQSLGNIHEAERIKDKKRHAEYLKSEKVFEDRMKLKDEFMKANNEKFMQPNEKSLTVPNQPKTWMDIDNSYKPGIGLLGKGEENDYDVYDTDFHGGRKTKNARKTKNTKKTKTARKTKNPRKTKKPKKTKTARKTKNPRKTKTAKKTKKI